MAISSCFFLGLFVFLPFVFKFFFNFVSPYAPNSEVPLLVVLSLISGVVSKEIGAYYLVGAFIVGLIGSRFKKEIFKDDEEQIFKSLNSFFNVFLPFYFFHAGLKLSLSGITLDSLKIGLGMLIFFVPLRLVLNSLSLKYFLKNIVDKPYQISLSLMPTLIFGLVIASVLKERGEVPETYIYALIIYTLISSLLPSILFSFKRKPKLIPPVA
jgi:Kef-type K+ transport system membrane component KefB